MEVVLDLLLRDAQRRAAGHVLVDMAAAHDGRGAQQREAGRGYLRPTAPHGAGVVVVVVVVAAAAAANDSREVDAEDHLVVLVHHASDQMQRAQRRAVHALVLP